jgi:hypothetical protein
MTMRKKEWRIGIALGFIAAFGLLRAAEQVSPGSGFKSQRKVVLSAAYKLVKSDLSCVAEAFYDEGCTKPLVKFGGEFGWLLSKANYQERYSMTLRFTVQHFGLAPAPPPPGRMSAAGLAQAIKAFEVKVNWTGGGMDVRELRIAPGEAEELCYQFNPQYFLSKPFPNNRLFFQIELDTTHVIDEANENNNNVSGAVMFSTQ